MKDHEEHLLDIFSSEFLQREQRESRDKHCERESRGEDETRGNRISLLSTVVAITRIECELVSSCDLKRNSAQYFVERDFRVASGHFRCSEGRGSLLPNAGGKN